MHRNTGATKPAADGGAPQLSPGPGSDAALCKILRSTGTLTRQQHKQNRAAAAAGGAPFSFRPGAEGTWGAEVRLGAGAWQAVPRGSSNMAKNDVFVSGHGLVFFDKTELHDCMVQPSAAPGDDCRFGARCTNSACKHAHPFACRFGVLCKKQGAGCRFLHPEPSSVVPVGKTYPRSQACKYGAACTNTTCHFAHPVGRVSVGRVPKQLWCTHSAADLSPLPAPRPLPLAMPKRATKFLFQGEFAFAFTPYPGTWAKEHFQSVAVHRYSPKARAHMLLAEYTLEGHYCNAAVGCGRYFVLSWWPYEDEAMRAIWEALRRERQMGKAMKAKDAEIHALERRATKATAAAGQQRASARQEAAQATAIIERQRKALRAKDAIIAGQRRQEAARQQQKQDRQEAARQRKEAARAAREQQKQDRRARVAAEQRWRQDRARAARDRSERLRYRDPIHIYALDGGRSGEAAADWVLVVDYHKGAHALELTQPPTGGGGHQQLLVTENDKVFACDLVAPTTLATLGKLPVVPGKLCADF